MSQTYTADCYGAAHGGQADLLLMEQNFAALKSTFSGAGAPSNPEAGMQWFDTTQKLLKVYNAAEDAWLGVLVGTGSLKMLVYRNTAEDGWAIDSGVTDKVVAIKGGATYTAGAATAGSWTLPDYTLLEADIPAHTHTGTTDSDGAHSHSLYEVTTTSGGTEDGLEENTCVASRYTRTTKSGFVVSSGSAHTHDFTSDSYGGGGSHNHGSAYRPSAAVVTIQYPDI